MNELHHPNIYVNSIFSSTKYYKVSPKDDLRTLVIIRIGAALTLVALVSIIIHILHPLPSASNICAPSSIAVGGSTALFPLMSTMIESYRKTCPDATISINQNVASSKAGLRTLAAGDIQIGNSDLVSSNLNLIDYPIAAVIYVMIANRQIAQVEDLSIAQIQNIYKGSFSNWSAVGGNNEPIIVVNRTSTSGTRAIFEKYLLAETTAFYQGKIEHYSEEDTSELVAHKVASTPGAIGYVNLRDALSTPNLKIVTINGVQAKADNVKKNTYTFWATEHIYTHKNPSDLTSSFIQHITSNSTRQIISNLGYIPLHDIPPATTNQHPGPIAPDGL